MKGAPQSAVVPILRHGTCSFTSSMNTEGEQDPPGPLLLLGKQEESLHLLAPLLGPRCSLVRTIGEAAVEAMASILRPTAILLEASELYLGGRTLHSRLKERSPDSRVIFLDVEGPWALFLEFEAEDTNDLRVQPCSVASLGETLMMLLECGSSDGKAMQASSPEEHVSGVLGRFHRTLRGRRRRRVAIGHRC